eukprot:m.33980 g.33980  ORF g.33980 m.33980 type:complete len:286 (+) comp15357_c0_seq1:102-959(+)
MYACVVVCACGFRYNYPYAELRRKRDETSPPPLSLCLCMYLSRSLPLSLFPTISTSGIIAIDDLKDKSPSIVEAFMPGIHGAQALAETVFGDNNPGGKMPVTLYDSSYIEQVDFLNMSMTNGPGRSYRYYTGTPLFTFGYGLSYTTFTQKWNPQPPPTTVLSSNGKNSANYTVTVTNTGDVAGDEVVQAYYKPDASSFSTLGDAPVIIKQMFGFERVHLTPGQSVTLHFNLDLENLSMVDGEGHRSIHPGYFDIIFSRGHGDELVTRVQVAETAPRRLETFRKWW